MSAKPHSASGIKVLYENFEDNVDSVGQGVDIVAIHGIGADPDTTWSWKGSEGERVNWLADPSMLPRAVPSARIMRFGYESNWFGPRQNELQNTHPPKKTLLSWVADTFLGWLEYYRRDITRPQNTQNTHPPKKTLVSQVANMLLGELEHYRRGITRPIIFIAHSYGGLVLIHALRSSFDNRAEWLDPFGHTVGLVFFGTPFRGRKGLSLQQMVEAIAQCNPDIDIYPETMALSVEENPYLEDLLVRFTRMRLDKPIPVRCFYETKPSPTGRVLRNMSLEDSYIVPENSACLDFSLGIGRSPLERNHYNLQRFFGPEDMGYKAVAKEIMDLVQGAESFMDNSLKREKTKKDDQKSQNELKLLAALAAGHDHEKSKNFNPPKVKNTCTWFLEDATFRSWRDSIESSFLWVSAGPGCGKSVLSRSLIDEKQLSTSDTSIVCYYFFKDGDETRQHGASALSAILHQLLIQDPTGDFMTHALKRYENYGKTLATNFSELWSVLLECATTPGAGEIVCALDALDECKEEDRKILIDKLREFFSDVGQKSYGRCRLKFFVTSRPYDTIERSIKRFLSPFCLQFDGDNHSAAISEDIDRVIDHGIRERMSHFTEDNRWRVLKRLKGIRNRTYLWLRLTFYIIDQNPSAYDRPSDIESLLSRLPDEHAKAYEEILNRTKSKNTRVLFQLMLAAERPLSIDEANYALTLATEKTPPATHSELEKGLRDNASFINQAKNFCGLLVDFHDSKLSFIHQTVREFLTDCPQEHGTWHWRGSFKLPECHAAISRPCISYLSLQELDDPGVYPGPGKRDYYSVIIDEISSGALFRCEGLSGWEDKCLRETLYHRERYGESSGETSGEAIGKLYGETLGKTLRKTYPFLLYASSSWITHYGKQHQSIGNDLLEEARKLCRRHLEITEITAPTMTLARNWAIAELRFAAEVGLAQIVRVILDGEGVNVNDYGHSYSRALWAASKGGYTDVVEMLLDAGAYVGAATVITALTLGHNDVLNLLFRKRREQDLATETVMQHVVSRESSILWLLEKCKEQVQITEAVMVAAAASGTPDTLQCVLEKRGREVQITARVMMAATRSWHRGVLHLLCNKWGEQIQVNDAVVAAARRSCSNGKEIIAILEEARKRTQVSKIPAE